MLEDRWFPYGFNGYLRFSINHSSNLIHRMRFLSLVKVRSRPNASVMWIVLESWPFWIEKFFITNVMAQFLQNLNIIRSRSWYFFLLNLFHCTETICIWCETWRQWLIGLDLIVILSWSRIWITHSVYYFACFPSYDSFTAWLQVDWIWSWVRCFTCWSLYFSHLIILVFSET